MEVKILNLIKNKKNGPEGFKLVDLLKKIKEKNLDESIINSEEIMITSDTAKKNDEINYEREPLH